MEWLVWVFIGLAIVWLVFRFGLKGKEEMGQEGVAGWIDTIAFIFLIVMLIYFIGRGLLDAMCCWN